MACEVFLLSDALENIAFAVLTGTDAVVCFAKFAGLVANCALRALLVPGFDCICPSMAPVLFADPAEFITAAAALTRVECICPSAAPVAFADPAGFTPAAAALTGVDFAVSFFANMKGAEVAPGFLDMCAADAVAATPCDLAAPISTGPPSSIVIV